MKKVSKINGIKEFCRSSIFSKILIVLGVMGMVIISFPYENKNKKIDRTDDSAYAKEYVAETEKRLTKILEKIEGVGDVSVMITISSSEEIIYAQNQKETRDFTSDSDKRETF